MDDHRRELETSKNNRPKSIRAERKPGQSDQQANVDDDKTKSDSRESHGTRKEVDGDDGKEGGGGLGKHCCFLGPAAASKTVEQTASEDEIERDDVNHRVDAPRFGPDLRA
ncbi:MAG TPA: hypothetical protein VJ846_07000 [Sphingomicrobium sp.]|jgi:hypothetical protein|nr:hypothetical protein [Sphingomicrobium sp.]